MGLADKQDELVSAFVRPSLEAGERQLAVLAVGTVGSAPALGGLVLLQTPYGIVVTDRRVFLVRMAKTVVAGYTPHDIEAEYPKASVSADFKGGVFGGKLLLQRPGAEPLKLNVHKIYQAGARVVAEALRA